ncbi:hypothetical protein BUALT_Bualt11G0016400 [Buddleja alternifolia]|uniref:C2 domain-containing protein n=1 Tax=Buddleja alternifolia TaxID=168488 RepID=A0AAV6WSD8_9LAMI|nr:hypothetical protein BUALT_Bualt11G0016400 [Buddleja alternifolia]
MDSPCHSSSFNCELTIIRARNINLKSDGQLFVRCFLSLGNNKRVRIDTQQISSSNSDLTWNQTFSLDCLGNQHSIKQLREAATIVFELRHKKSSPSIISRINGSKLLGRAEIPWRNVVDSPNMAIEEWVVMISKNGCIYDDVIKPRGVQISMKVEELSKGIMKRKINERKWDDECGCMDGGCNNSCVEYEFFAVGAALDAF